MFLYEFSKVINPKVSLVCCMCQTHKTKRKSAFKQCKNNATELQLLNFKKITCICQSFDEQCKTTKCRLGLVESRMYRRLTKIECVQDSLCFCYTKVLQCWRKIRWFVNT